jgi:hypothetical protein
MAPRQIDGRCDVTPPSFETDIKPMFRERDRQSMQRAFDLWSYDDVSQHADAILTGCRQARCPAMARGRQRRSTFFNAGPRAANLDERDPSRAAARRRVRKMIKVVRQ